jgi:hypothetical protein
MRRRCLSAQQNPYEGSRVTSSKIRRGLGHASPLFVCANKTFTKDLE